MQSARGVRLRSCQRRLDPQMASAACPRPKLPSGGVLCLLAAGLLAAQLHLRRTEFMDPAGAPTFVSVPVTSNRVSTSGHSPLDSQVHGVHGRSPSHTSADASRFARYGIVGAVLLALASRVAARQARHGIPRAKAKVVVAAASASAGEAIAAIPEPPKSHGANCLGRNCLWSQGEQAIGSPHRQPDGAANEPIGVAPPPSVLGNVADARGAASGASPGVRGGLTSLGGMRRHRHRASGKRMGNIAGAAAAREQQHRRRLGSKLQRSAFDPRVEAFDPSRLRTAIQVGQQRARNLRVANGRERKTLATGSGAVSEGSSSTRSQSIRFATNHGKTQLARCLREPKRKARGGGRASRP